jgi:hypothetical protein
LFFTSTRNFRFHKDYILIGIMTPRTLEQVLQDLTTKGKSTSKRPGEDSTSSDSHTEEQNRQRLDERRQSRRISKVFGDDPVTCPHCPARFDEPRNRALHIALLHQNPTGGGKTNTDDPKSIAGRIITRRA